MWVWGNDFNKFQARAPHCLEAKKRSSGKGLLGAAVL